MSIVKLSGDYIRGYTKALMDIQELLPTVIVDLKRFKRKLDGKHLNDFFKLIIEHRESLREETGGFIRFNWVKKELEWYEPDRKT